MNLEESDKFVEQQRQTEQKKKVVLISIVLCLVLIVLLFIWITYLQYQDSLKLKVYVDGTQVKIGSNLLYQEDDITYINVKSIAEIMGYTYTKGEYKKYNEDINSCYIKNDLELVSMTVESNVFTKYIEVNNSSKVLTKAGPYGTAISVNSGNGEANTYNIKTPMKLVKEQIYMPFELMRDVFNVSVNINEENTRIRIYTLPNLFRTAVDVAGKLGYDTISGVYENIRAIPYGMIVVARGGKYGFIDANSGRDICSTKYENIEFIQNIQEFFIKAENTVGLVDNTGKVIVEPTEYDDIQVLDELEQLYLVKKDGKYGVLNRNGEIIIHADYDRIGLRKIDNFDTENMRNKNLLHDKCIVVEQDSLYGLYSIEGEELLKTVYEELGYTTTSSDSSGEKNVLLLPATTGIKGIVLKFNGLYGIYDVNKKSIIIPCACNRIYSITRAGVTKYYMEFGEEQIELDNYLTSYNLKSENINSNEKDNSQTSELNEGNTLVSNTEEVVEDERVEDETVVVVEN